MPIWEAVPPWLRNEALRDLRVDGQVRPTLVAFAGDRPALLALCRSFEPGDAVQALTELLALAILFRADRVAVTFGGRARTLDAAGASSTRPGQQIVLVAVAQACGTKVTVDCTTVPIMHVQDGCNPGELVAGEPLATGAAEGWLPRMLAVALEQRADMDLGSEELVRQTARCLALGHQLYLPATP
jgi:hypothetical protein